MNFGGPVWHASARGLDEAVSWAMAERALKGVGDPALGEWREHGSAMHIRRRLTDAERASVGGMEVRDIRGTWEEQKRLRAVYAAVPELRNLLN